MVKNKGCSFSRIPTNTAPLKSLQSFYSLAISEAPTATSVPSKIRGFERAWECAHQTHVPLSGHTAGPRFPASSAASHRLSPGQWKVGTFHLPGLAHKNLSHLPLLLFPNLMEPEVALGDGGATRVQSPTPQSHWFMT